MSQQIWLDFQLVLTKFYSFLTSKSRQFATIILLNFPTHYIYMMAASYL